jgi:hypothetical protein
MPQFCVWIFAPGTRKIGDNLKLVEPAALFFGSARLSADGKSYAFSFQRDLATLYLVKGREVGRFLSFASGNLQLWAAIVYFAFVAPTAPLGPDLGRNVAALAVRSDGLLRGQ